jgi:two-component system phosphate regulon sensor histidine kinase PhoR
MPQISKNKPRPTLSYWLFSQSSVGTWGRRPGPLPALDGCRNAVGLRVGFFGVATPQAVCVSMLVSVCVVGCVDKPSTPTIIYLMRQRFGIDRYSLIVQLVLSFVVLVLLTALAAGLPAILLIGSQIQRQAWEQVDHGGRATEARYAAWESNVTHLATLTSHRPTLHALLAQGNETELTQYLQVLREDAELDLLLICDHAQQLVNQAEISVTNEICTIEEAAGFYILSIMTSPQVWLLAAHAISTGPAAGTVIQPKVIAGVVLDDDFLIRSREQTGLEHTLIVDGRPAASSLPGGVSDQRSVTGYPDAARSTDTGNHMNLQIDDQPYYTSRIPLDHLGRVHGFHLEDEIALSVGDIAATQRNLVWALSGSVIAITLVGSILAVFLARRIGRPLAQLADAASTFSEGNMDQPVIVRAGVREVSQVAQALEQERIDLRQTITELREAQAWTEHLLEAIVEGIVILDEKDRITFFSSGAERVTGWSKEAALGRSCDEVFQLAESDDPFSRHLPPVGKRHKITLRLDGDRQVTLAITGARLTPPTSAESGVGLVLRDVSETETMHRLVGEFLANITHEFRTPLSALAASAELLLDQAPTLSRAELQELLTALHLSILSLQTLIDNLLESAKLEAGRFRVYPHSADLGQMIAEAAHIMQPLQAKYNQRLVLELPTPIPTVHADPRRTAQVLVNLLSNAIRYSPDNTEITIRVTTVDNWARVAVADHGPGVPEGYRSDLFLPFVHPAPRDSQSRHGAGLGLSVAKAIIEAHGGEVGVEDRPGGGSIFWFTLPLVDEHASISG